MGMYYHCMENDIKISKVNLSALEQKLGKSIFVLAEEQDYMIEVEGDENGVDNIYFSESSRWESSFFQQIAPFVENGGYIQIAYEREDVFRLMYRGGKMYRVAPKWEISPE